MFFYKEEAVHVTEGISNVDDLNNFAAQYEVGDQIGRGAYSVVYICRKQMTGQLFALKVIDKRVCSKRQGLRDEIIVLSRMKHPNIIHLEAIFEGDDELYLVMEYASGGELFDRIAKEGVYTERQAAGTISNILIALDYLHHNNIMHRDIKPENILLANQEGTLVKLSDFGIAKILEDPLDAMNEDNDSSPKRSTRMRAYTSCGSDYYVAPEVLVGQGYNNKVDLWSVGVVLYIMLCGFPPFSQDEGSLDTICSKILAKKLEFPHPYWTNVSDSAKSLITNMLQVDPEIRYSAKDALKHPWINVQELASENPVAMSSMEEMRRFNRKRRLTSEG